MPTDEPYLPPSSYGRGYRRRRASERQREAQNRLAAYDGRVNLEYDRLVASDSAIALQKFLISLSPSQRERLLHEFGVPPMFFDL